MRPLEIGDEERRSVGAPSGLQEELAELFFVSNVDLILHVFTPAVAP